MREPVRDRDRLEHIVEAIDPDAVWKVIQEDLPPLREQVCHYLSETDWGEWEHSEVVISESAAHKSLVQTAERMKRRGYDIEEICKITGLEHDEIETL